MVMRDRLIQRGEVASLWDALPEETYERWGMAPPERPHWHIGNPTVLRFVIPHVTLAQVDWIAAKWVVTDERGVDRVIAARLWCFDIDSILAELQAQMGRPVDPQVDVVVVDAERRGRWVKRRAADGTGMMWNKAARDIPLNDPSRIGG